MVWGEPGCGKSALISKFYLNIASDLPTSFVWIHIVSATIESFKIRDLLFRLCSDLVKHFGLLIKVDTDLSVLRFQLILILKESSRKLEKDPNLRIIIILDAVNQMSAEGGAYSMNWLPFNDIPDCVRFIITTLPHKCLDNMTSVNETYRPEEIKVPLMDQESLKDLVRGYLGQFNKHLSEDHTDSLLKNQMEILLKKEHGTLPLYLMAACEVLLTFGGAYELMTQFLEKLGDTIPTLFEQLLTFVEDDHGYDLVKQSLSLIASSPSGLMELEMIELVNQYQAESHDARSNFSRLYAQTKLFLGGIGSGRIQLFHDQLLFTVRKRYGLDPPVSDNITFCNTNNTLATFYMEKLNRRENESFTQAVLLYPYFLLRSSIDNWLLIINILCSLSFLQLRCELELAPVMMQDIVNAINYLEHIIDSKKMNTHEITSITNGILRLKNRMTFIRRRMGMLMKFPKLVIQIALNERNNSSAHEEAISYFQQINNKNNTSSTITKTNENDNYSFPISTSKYIFHQTNKPTTDGYLISSLYGHFHYVSDLEFSHDNTLLLSCSLDSTLKVWNLKTCSEESLLKGHIGGVTCCKFLENNILSGGEDGTVRFWDASTGLEISSYTMEGIVTSISVAADGKTHTRHVCVSSESGHVYILDYTREASPTLISSLPYDSPALDVSFHPNTNNHIIVCGYRNGDVCTYTYDNTKKITLQIRKKFGSVVSSVLFIPHLNNQYNGKLLAIGTYEKKVFVVNSSSLDILTTIQGFGWIYRLAVSHDGTHILVKHRSSTAAFISAFPSDVHKDPGTWDYRLQGRFSGHRGNITGIAISSSDMLATGSEDKSIMIWKTPTQADVTMSKRKNNQSIDFGQEMFMHSSGTLKVMFINNVIVSFGQTSFAIHSILSGEVLASGNYDECSYPSMTCVAINTQLIRLFVGANSKSLFVYNINLTKFDSKGIPTAAECHEAVDSIQNIAISAITAIQIIHTESTEFDILVYGTKDGKLSFYIIHRQQQFSGELTPLNIHMTEGTVCGHASGSFIHSVHQTESAEGHFTNNEIQFTTTGDDDVVMIWSLKDVDLRMNKPSVTLHCQLKVEGHRNLTTQALLMTPSTNLDTRILLSSSEDCTVRGQLFNSSLVELSPSTVLVRHDSGVRDMASIQARGHIYLLSASLDGSLLVSEIVDGINVTHVVTLATAGEILACAVQFDESMFELPHPDTKVICLGLRIAVGLKSGYTLFYVA